MSLPLSTTPPPEYTLVANLLPQFGIARTRAYELLRDKKIVARKFGNRTLVDVSSVRDYLASLPTYQARG
jgi:hypothetical protein